MRQLTHRLDTNDRLRVKMLRSDGRGHIQCVDVTQEAKVRSVVVEGSGERHCRRVDCISARQQARQQLVAPSWGITPGTASCGDPGVHCSPEGNAIEV